MPALTRGEVWLASLDPVQGSEQAGRRPVLVVQSDALNALLRTAIVIPFTTNTRWQEFPFCVLIPAGMGGLSANSVALCHQARVLDRTRLIARWGQVNEATLRAVDRALTFTISG